MASIIDADRLGQGNGPSTVPRRLVVPLSSHWDTQRALPANVGVNTNAALGTGSATPDLAAASGE